jgi:hypothetical protein
MFQILLLRKEGSPYFGVRKNKHEHGFFRLQSSELNGIFNFVNFYDFSHCKNRGMAVYSGLYVT